MTGVMLQVCHPEPKAKDPRETVYPGYRFAEILRLRAPRSAQDDRTGVLP